MGMSDKDKCFEKAIDKVEDVGKQKIGVENQAPWVKDLNGTWRQIPKDTAFQSIMGSIKKTLGIQSGNLPANARLPGKPDPIQVRYPDVTVDTPGGKVVIDNKFTNGKGGIDPWGSKPGTGGNTQLPDYNDINQKNTGNPNAKNLSLDKNTCKCDEKGKAEPVRVYQSQTSVATDPALGKVFVVPLPLGPLPALPSFGLNPGVFGLRPIFVP